jgi:hypothetical protein
MVGASSRRGRQTRQGAMTTFSSAASPNQWWLRSGPDGAAATVIRAHAVRPEPALLREALVTHRLPDEQGVGPPYAATQWRSRATRKKRADGGSAASTVSGSGNGRLSSRAISGNAFAFLT